MNEQILSSFYNYLFLLIHQDVVKDYLEKRDRGQLYSQQIRDEPNYQVCRQTFFLHVTLRIMIS